MSSIGVGEAASCHRCYQFPRDSIKTYYSFTVLVLPVLILFLLRLPESLHYKHIFHCIHKASLVSFSPPYTLVSLDKPTHTTLVRLLANTSFINLLFLLLSRLPPPPPHTLQRKLAAASKYELF